MGSHPLNLVIRFLLEIAALIAMGIWGWHLTDSWLRFLAAPGIPLVMAGFWGIFAVPNDPSRSGKTVVKTPGILRLIYELFFFGFAVFALYKTGFQTIGLITGIIILVHYIFSYDRVAWLARN